jgi:hypothetical protein
MSEKNHGIEAESKENVALKSATAPALQTTIIDISGGLKIAANNNEDLSTDFAALTLQWLDQSNVDSVAANGVADYIQNNTDHLKRFFEKTHVFLFPKNNRIALNDIRSILIPKCLERALSQLKGELYFVWNVLSFCLLPLSLSVYRYFLSFRAVRSAEALRRRMQARRQLGGSDWCSL